MESKTKFTNSIEKQKKEGGGKLFFSWLLKLHELLYSKEYKQILKSPVIQSQVAKLVFGKDKRPDIRYFMQYLMAKKILAKQKLSPISMSQEYLIIKQALEDEIEKWKIFNEVYDYCYRKKLVLEL